MASPEYTLVPTTEIRWGQDCQWVKTMGRGWVTWTLRVPTRRAVGRLFVTMQRARDLVPFQQSSQRRTTQRLQEGSLMLPTRTAASSCSKGMSKVLSARKNLRRRRRRISCPLPLHARTTPMAFGSPAGSSLRHQPRMRAANKRKRLSRASALLHRKETSRQCYCYSPAEVASRRVLCAVWSAFDDIVRCKEDQFRKLSACIHYGLGELGPLDKNTVHSRIGVGFV